MADPRYLTASEAAGELGITLPTLYAYVSRGLVRSEAAGSKKRTRRYLREDIARLKERKAHRRDPHRTAKTALRWGAPVLDSAITLIDNDRLYYRGHDATALAREHSLEAVAGLIWRENLGSPFPAAPPLPLAVAAAMPGIKNLSYMETFQAALPLAAAADLQAFALTPDSVAEAGARILHLMAGLIHPPRGRIAQTLATAWAANQPEAVRIMNAALVLCIDHELNVSSFTVRCVASADSTPYAAVIAGLAALQGAKHGGATERAEAFLREVDSVGDAGTAIRGRLRRGEGIPGFGHRLYLGGDPRGAALINLLKTGYPQNQAFHVSESVIAAVDAITGEKPNIDFGLATLGRTLALPAGSAIAIFALGRTVGWIGQAIEQYRSGNLIRPRARYIGPAPRMDPK